MGLAPIVARDGNNAAQNMGVAVDAVNTINYPMVTLDSTQAIYRASANFTPLSTAAVTLISIKGSATKTVRVKRILMGGVATANAQSIIGVIRTSALGTGGTAVTPTISLLDKGSTAYPAATAVVTHYTTAAQSSGTTTGNGFLTTFSLQTSVVAVPTLGPNGQLQSVFPEAGGHAGAIVLRGTSDFLEIQNVTPANMSTASVLCYVIEFIEDAS